VLFSGCTWWEDVLMCIGVTADHQACYLMGFSYK